MSSHLVITVLPMRDGSYIHCDRPMSGYTLGRLNRSLKARNPAGTDGEWRHIIREVIAKGQTTTVRIVRAIGDDTRWDEATNKFTVTVTKTDDLTIRVRPPAEPTVPREGTPPPVRRLF